MAKLENITAKDIVGLSDVCEGRSMLTDNFFSCDGEIDGMGFDAWSDAAAQAVVDDDREAFARALGNMKKICGM